jgi:hypothetical protein
VGQEAMNPTAGSEEEARFQGAREEAKRIVNRLIQDVLTKQAARQQLRKSERERHFGIFHDNCFNERAALS